MEGNLTECMERNWPVSGQSQSVIFQFQTKIAAAVFEKG